MLRDVVSSVQHLYNCGLYSNVVEVCNLTNCAKEIYSEKVPAGQLCMVQVLLADSYLELREWKLAENLYRKDTQHSQWSSFYVQSTLLRSHCIGRELQSVEIFSCSERSYYRPVLSVATPAVLCH